MLIKDPFFIYIKRVGLIPNTFKQTVTISPQDDFSPIGPHIVGAAGKEGYNISFPTEKSLPDILDTFSTYLSLEASIDYFVLSDTLVRTDDRNHPYLELAPDSEYYPDIQRLGQIDQIPREAIERSKYVVINVNNEDFDMPYHIWYNRPSTWVYSGQEPEQNFELYSSLADFVINVDKFDPTIFDKAFGLTKYPIDDKDRDFFRNLFDLDFVRAKFQEYREHFQKEG